MVHVWNLETHDVQTGGLAFDPSGTRLATGADDGVIKVWDLAFVDGEAVSFDVLTLRRHRGPVTAFAFTPDGRTLLSVGGISAGKFGEVGGFSGGPPAPDGVAGGD